MEGWRDGEMDGGIISPVLGRARHLPLKDHQQPSGHINTHSNAHTHSHEYPLTHIHRHTHTAYITIRATRIKTMLSSTDTSKYSQKALQYLTRWHAKDV